MKAEKAVPAELLTYMEEQYSTWSQAVLSRLQ